MPTFQRKVIADCHITEFRGSEEGDEEQEEEAVSPRLSFFSASSPCGSHLLSDVQTEALKGGGSQREEKKEGRYHQQEIERVPQVDVRELDLGLCSGLQSYIRVKQAPPLRAQQDVAEEEE